METAKEKRDSPRLVVFGCGYVGTAVALRALEKGWRVFALTRNAEQAEELRAHGVSKVVVADLHMNEWHKELSGDYEYCLDCVSSAGGGLEGYKLSYLEGLKSIRQWAEQRKVGAFVYTSSTSVYPQTGGQWVDETFSNEGVNAAAEVLLEAERNALAEPMPWERAFVLRLSGIYGPGRHMLLDQIRAGATSLSGTGDHYLNLIHRDDVVSAIERVFECHRDNNGGVYNLNDGCPFTKAEVVAWLAEQAGMPVPVFSGEIGDGPRARLFRQGPMPSRRIANWKFCEAFGWSPRFIDFKAGYLEILKQQK